MARILDFAYPPCRYGRQGYTATSVINAGRRLRPRSRCSGSRART